MEEEVFHELECIHFPSYSAVFSIYRNVQPQLKAPEKYVIEGFCSFLFQYYVLSYYFVSFKQIFDIVFTFILIFSQGIE